jgi:hypothetical protein
MAVLYTAGLRLGLKARQRRNHIGFISCGKIAELEGPYACFKCSNHLCHSGSGDYKGTGIALDLARHNDRKAHEGGVGIISQIILLTKRPGLATCQQLVKRNFHLQI